MAKIKRNIVHIDEGKCNGCGLCIPSCKEGAIQLIDGKAKLVSDIYCDGLGACLGKCPQDAIKIEQREADEFDEEAVKNHLKETPDEKPKLACGCPGTMTRSLKRENRCETSQEKQNSELSQWPIQLTLIPADAPYLKNADFVLLADCTAVAYAGLHPNILRNRVIAMACPKLDETGPYVEKLKQMIEHNDFRSFEVVMMEVPCCQGLEKIAQEAAKLAKNNIHIKRTIITVEGEKID